jgi:hypothetical protein
MNPGAAHVQDRLLDFAYGELSVDEAHAVEVHMAECPSCRAALEQIRGVRQVMAKLPQPAAPQAGLESLLAYAEQAARRARGGAPPKHTWWRRWLAPVGGLAAVVTFGIVANEVSRAPELQYPREQAIAEKLNENQKVAETAAPSAPAPMKDAQPSAGEPMRGEPPGEEASGNFRKLAAPRQTIDRPIDRAEAEHSYGFGTGRSGSRGSAGEQPTIGGARGLGSGSSPVGVPAQGVDRAKKKPPKKAAPASPKTDRASEEDHFAPDGRSDAQMAPPPSVAQGALNAEAKREPVQKMPTPERESRSEISARPAVRAAPLAPTGPPAPAAAAVKSRAPVASAELPAPATAAGKSRDADVGEESAAIAPRYDSTRMRAEALSQQAIAAQREGSRALEAQYLREALATGVADQNVLTNLLLRLCEAELAVGHITEGRAACERVLRDFPGTRAAQVATRRLEESRAGRTQPAQPVEMTR